MFRNVISHALSTAAAAMLMIFAVSDLHAAPAAEANTIVLKDFHFSPMSLTVPAGATVIWKNLDGEWIRMTVSRSNSTSPARTDLSAPSIPA